MNFEEYRKIEAIIAPPPAHMVGDGFRVHNFFPHWKYGHQRMSPFYLLDYMPKTQFPPSDRPRGVGVHPHRGFETVTIVYEGKIAHHDSAGNNGIIAKGDVQWMTVGSGVLHKEYHEESFAKEGGEVHIAQIWVNLPAANKMTAPRYQDLLATSQTTMSLPEDAGIFTIIAGQYEDCIGKAITFSPMLVGNIHINSGKSITLDIPSHFNACILVISGSCITAQNERIYADHMILFENMGHKIYLHSDEDCTLLLLSGEPISEPIVAYGPFLMNTKEEIQQAIRDVQFGRFGYLE
jgi:redox-sensitive bicupin YhaK (pirin superfamily)